MSESNKTNPSANGSSDNRRRKLLVALLGAGVPLAHRALPGEWTAPIVDSVILPVHAQTSPGGDGPNPVGNFGSGTETRAVDSSVFENIVHRTEEEILNLFVSTAEAADICAVPDCSFDNDAGVTVAVAATINNNPSSSECVEARVVVTGSSCEFCTIIEFEANVDGQDVSVSENCGLSLTGMTLSEGGLTGSWSYTPSGSDKSKNGTFSSPRDDFGGCGSLTCDP